MDEKTIERLDDLGVDFYSMRHYKLLRLFNMAGVEESEDIIDDMLTLDLLINDEEVSESDETDNSEG